MNEKLSTNGDRQIITEAKNSLNERKYLLTEKTFPQRFTINALRRVRHDDKLTVRASLNVSHAQEWKKATATEAKTLQEMKWWTETATSKGKKVLHSRFMLVRKRDETGKIQKYEAHVIVCENEEEELAQVSFSPVAAFKIIKLVLRLTVHRGWQKGYFDFQNAFPNGKLDCPVFIDPPRYVQNEKDEE